MCSEEDRMILKLGLIVLYTHIMFQDQVCQDLQGMWGRKETRDPEAVKAPRGQSSLGHWGQRANQDSQVQISNILAT